MEKLIDKIRSDLSALQAEEERLLSESVKLMLSTSVITRGFLVLVVAVTVRLIAWYLFKIDILRRINHLVDNAFATTWRIIAINFLKPPEKCWRFGTRSFQNGQKGFDKLSTKPAGCLTPS